MFVVAGGTNLLYPGQNTLALVRCFIEKTHGPVALRPLLVEELLVAEDGRPGLLDGYQFHSFGGHIAMIERTVRHRVRRGSAPLSPTIKTGRYESVSAYHPDWSPMKVAPCLKLPAAAPARPPKCLDEMLSVARRLGEAYETYVRIDMHATQSGPFLGELSSAPSRGRGVTREIDVFLGQAWKRHIPARI